MARVIGAVLGTITFILIVIAVSFLIVSGLLYFACWGLGFAWSWQLCVGIYAVMILLGSVFRITVTSKEK